jgi:sigma-E factor negative regulatory protein RseA
MKAKISALMDGELERRDAGGALDALRGEGEARETWRHYHLIGDSMRDARQLTAGFAARVTAKLADEPTVLAPRARTILEQRRWQLLSAAASIAAVAFVSFAFFSQDPAGPAAPVVPIAPVAQSAAPAETAQVAPPEAANDYLLAHQGYSPRNSLQGMAAYVRTVSSEARGSRQ